MRPPTHQERTARSSFIKKERMWEKLSREGGGSVTSDDNQDNTYDKDKDEDDHEEPLEDEHDKEQRKEETRKEKSKPKKKKETAAEERHPKPAGKRSKSRM